MESINTLDSEREDNYKDNILARNVNRYYNGSEIKPSSKYLKQIKSKNEYQNLPDNIKRLSTRRKSIKSIESEIELCG